MQAKQQVAPLQTNEVANIRRKTASFDVEQYNFRESFRQEAPYKYDSETPYSKLDAVSLFPYFIHIHLPIYLIIYSSLLNTKSVMRKFSKWNKNYND